MAKDRCSPAIAPGPAYLIAVAGGSRDFDDVTHTVRHEVAHGWLSEPRPLLPAKTAHGQANVRALAEAEGWSVIPAVDARHGREERLAEALAKVWGSEARGMVKPSSPPPQARRAKKGHRRGKAFSTKYRRDADDKREVALALAAWLRRREHDV